MTPCSLGPASGLPQTVLAETLDSGRKNSVLGRRLRPSACGVCLAPPSPRGCFPRRLPEFALSAPRLHTQVRVYVAHGRRGGGKTNRRRPFQESIILMPRRDSRDQVRPQTKDARSGCRGPSRCAAAHVTSASKARPFRRLPTRVHQCQVAVTSARRAAPRVPRTWPWLLRTAAAVWGVAPESRDSPPSARSVPFATKVASLRSGYNSGSFLKSSCAKSCIYFLKKLVDFYLGIVSDLQRNRNARMEGVRVLRTPPPTADVLCCSVLSSEPVNQS